MRPNTANDNNLSVANAKVHELRDSWRTANSNGMDDLEQSKPRTGVVHGAREAAGRGLIGLGQKVFPGDIQPCDD